MSTRERRTLADMNALWRTVRDGAAAEADLAQYARDKKIMHRASMTGDYPPAQTD